MPCADTTQVHPARLLLHPPELDRQFCLGPRQNHRVVRSPQTSRITMTIVKPALVLIHQLLARSRSAASLKMTVSVDLSTYLISMDRLPSALSLKCRANGLPVQAVPTRK